MVLHLIGGPGASALVLRRLGTYGLEPELEDYVLNALRSRWPRVAVTRAENADELRRVHQQVWLCARRPPKDTLSPVLWLDGIGTDAAPTRLSPRSWRLSAPITADRLLFGIECLLAAAPDG